MTYSPATTLYKSITTGLSTSLLFAAMEFAATANVPESREGWRVFAVGIAAALIRGTVNWWKNQGRELFEEMTK